MVMALQRQRRARVDHNALYLEPLTNHQTLVPTLGAVVAGYGLCLRHALGLQRGNHLLDLLGAVLVGNQNCIGHGNSDDIGKPKADQLLVCAGRMQQSVLALQCRRRAGGDSAAGIGLGFPPHRLLVAQIGPGAIIGKH